MSAILMVDSPFRGHFKEHRLGAGDDATAETKEQLVEINSRKDFQDIQAEFDKAAEITVVRRPACPAHELGLLLRPKQNRLARVWNAVIQILLALAFVLFPPWPPRIMRKILFRAPPRGHYYHLIYGQGKERRTAFSARDALGKPDVRICLPMLLDKKVDAVDVYYHIIRSKPVILPVDDDINICVVHLRCELTRVRLTEAGRSPFLMIFCQPNSSDLGSCLLMEPNFADMADFLRCDMLFFDYPGYGVSDGQPCEFLIYRSAECVLEYARELGYDDAHVILIGFSLGTAAAIHLASNFQVGALVLMAPFTSFLRVGFNCPKKEKSVGFDFFRSIDKAAAITSPTLVCHGTKDVIVKQTHGEMIAFEIEGAQLFLVEDATHQALLAQRKMWDKVDQFLEAKLGIDAAWKYLLRSVVPFRSPYVDTTPEQTTNIVTTVVSRSSTKLTSTDKSAEKTDKSNTRTPEKSKSREEVKEKALLPECKTPVSTPIEKSA